MSFSWTVICHSPLFLYLSIYLLATYTKVVKFTMRKKIARQRITLQLYINNFPPLKIAFIIPYWKKYLLSQNMYCCLVAELCPTLCDPMDCKIPGCPVLHHHSPEFAQTHVFEMVMPSSHLILCSPLLLNLSQHWGPFQWVSSSHQMAKVLELQLQHLSFQWVFRVRVDFL